MEFLKKVHAVLAPKFLQYFGSLIMEQKDEDGDGTYTWMLSTGRVAFWLVFSHMLYVFKGGLEVSAAEMNVFYALLAYQGAKITKDTVTESVAAWKTPAAKSDEE